jgi:hypothetical protein
MQPGSIRRNQRPDDPCLDVIAGAADVILLNNLNPLMRLVLPPDVQQTRSWLFLIGVRFRDLFGARRDRTFSREQTGSG